MLQGVLKENRICLLWTYNVGGLTVKSQSLHHSSDVSFWNNTENTSSGTSPQRLSAKDKLLSLMDLNSQPKTIERWMQYFPLPKRMHLSVPGKHNENTIILRIFESIK